MESCLKNYVCFCLNNQIPQFLFLLKRIASPRNPGGANNIVGTVDKNGSGVPFILCTTNTKKVVIAETINTEIGIEAYLFLIFIRKNSNILTMIPPNKKV